MAILITGGTGFIGSHLAQLLVEHEKEKLVLFDMFPNATAVRDLGDRVTIVRGDFSEPTELMTALKQHNVSDVFHLGYFTAESEAYPAQAIRVNCDGTNRVFECARIAGVRRVMWPSSAAVYGHSQTSANPMFMREDDKFTPNSIYGACKLFNEHVAEVYAERNGFDHIGLRLCSVYGLGRGQRRGINPDIYAQIVEKPYAVEEFAAPPADHVLTWGYAKDAAAAFYAAYKAQKPAHRIFNFGGESRPVKDAVERIKQLCPKAKLTCASQGIRHLAYLNTERIQKELGFKSGFSMHDGLADYVKRLGGG